MKGCLIAIKTPMYQPIIVRIFTTFKRAKGGPAERSLMPLKDLKTRGQLEGI